MVEMRRLEIGLGVVFVASLIMQYDHVPFGGVLTVLSATFLAMLYYPLGVKTFLGLPVAAIFDRAKRGDVEKKAFMGVLVAGIAFSLVCIGVLFKVQLWPSSDPMLLAGLIPTFIVLGISGMRYSNNRDLLSAKLLLRSAVLAVMGLIFFLASDLDLVKVRYRNYPAYIEAYRSYREDPTDPNRRKQLEMESRKIYMGEEEFRKWMESQGE